MIWTLAACVACLLAGLALGWVAASRRRRANAPPLSTKGPGLAPVRAAFADDVADCIDTALRGANVSPETREALEDVARTMAANAWSQGLADVCDALCDVGLPPELGEQVGRQALRRIEAARGLA